MSRATIDFGIDLGTSNSEIACMDRGELVVVKNTITGSEITPSVVKVDAKGTIVVGQAAYNALEYDPENTVGEFKRWMGNAGHDWFRFKRSDKRMTAAELSAEVLKILKVSAASRFGGEQVNAAVITVPAMFLIPACEDTKTAAKLAGIETCPLLQEPVAAAMAYGYKAQTLTGNLLVFDLGGGTFDTTIVAAKEGRLVVVGHDGDDKLGGKDYDWAIVEVLINRLEAEFGPLGLKRGGARGRAMAKLKYLAEDAKKTLSQLPTANVEINQLGDGLDEVDTVVQLTRSDFEKATEHLTKACVSIADRLLDKVRLSRDDLTAVLLVGGQTQSTSVRVRVSEHYGKADFRFDPLTVVAAGAALFASTQRIPSSKYPKTGQGSSIEVKAAYSPVSSELDSDIAVAVDPPASGATVTISRTDGGWTSGAIPLPSNGKIHTTVVLRAKKVNAFEVQVLDRTGGRIPGGVTAFSITHGLAVAQATTSRAFGVALENNEVKIIIPNGAPLPAKGTQKFATAHEVIAGNRKSSLKIYVLEGDNPRADRNIKIGEIVLNGDELRRSLPVGESVEVTYRLDESKTLSAEAVFPSLREARQMEYKPERPQLRSEEIEIEVKKERGRIAKLERAVPERINPQLNEQIVKVEKEQDASDSDHDAAQKAAQQLIELKQTLDKLEKSSEWELLLLELPTYKEDIPYVESVGSADEIRRYKEAVTASERAIAEHDLGSLRECVTRLRDIYWPLALSQDDVWKGQFARMSEQEDFVDPLKAERLKEEGFRALKRGDMDSLRTIVLDLCHLLPTWQQGKLDDRFKDAGLRHARGHGA
ncbi:MAG TPA: Hsp70 family protein [Terriglobales bacterium]|nr:Hsp70 family protein [Terriglobales bacterium]